MTSNEIIKIVIIVAATLAKIGVIMTLTLGMVPILTWLERRGAAFIQDRLGPNRTSIFGIALFGLIQPIADAVKLIFKEDVQPRNADKFLFNFAPMLIVFGVLITFSVIPFGPDIVIELTGEDPKTITIPLQLADINAGMIFALAFSSFATYAILLGGWASNNKYSILGALRSSAQMISYEITMGLSLIGLFMMFKTVSINEIVIGQGQFLWGIVWQPVGFILFLVTAMIESNRVPFDMPEADSEIVAGFHTEYSSMKFAMYFMGEYAAMVVLSGLIVTLFLGGWQLPFVDITELVKNQYLCALLGFSIFFGKVLFFLWFFVWTRWTFPRFRFDQIMNLGWKILFPLGLVNLLVTALFVLLYWDKVESFFNNISFFAG